MHSRWCVTVAVMGVLLLIPPLLAQPAPTPAQIVIPDAEFAVGEFPTDADGDWFILHQVDGVTHLVRGTVVFQAFHDACLDEDAGAQSGRRVTMPGVPGAIMAIRGVPGVVPGVVPTARMMVTRKGLAGHVALEWSGGQSAVMGEEIGVGYRVILERGSQLEQLYRTEGHDGGSWEVRWAGDLNGDHRLDLLLDATRKYSVAATRLLLSGPEGLVEIARFARTGC